MLILSNKKWHCINNMIKYLYSSSEDMRNIRSNFLIQLHDVINFDKASFELATRKGSNVKFFDSIAYNMDPDYIGKLTGEYAAFDTISWFFFDDTPAVSKESDYSNNKIRSTSKFHKEWMEPQNIKYCLFSRVVHNAILYGSINLWNSSNTGDFSEQDVYILEILNEHLSILFYRKYPHGINQKQTVDYLNGIPTKYNFTKSEIKVLNLICNGLTIKEISAELYISESTVKKHTSNIFKKAGVKNKINLTKLVIHP